MICRLVIESIKIHDALFEAILLRHQTRILVFCPLKVVAAVNIIGRGVIGVQKSIFLNASLAKRLPQ